MVMSNAASRDRNRLADVYAHIAAHAGSSAAHIEDALGRACAAHWAVGVLLERGMIVRLANTPGVHGVDSRFSTVRAAR
jgi:hypothetical protein